MLRFLMGAAAGVAVGWLARSERVRRWVMPAVSPLYGAGARGDQGAEQQAGRNAGEGGTSGSPTRDPVCGKEIAADGNPHRAEYADQTYYFCSAACQARFEEEADMFTSGPAAGRVADRDRGVRDDEHEGELSPTAPAKLEQPPVDAGPG